MAPQPIQRLLTIAALALAGSTGPGRADPAPEHAALRLFIQHVFGDLPLRPDDVSCRTGGENTLSISRLSYLISHIALAASDGTRTELADTFGFINAVAGRTAIDLPPLPRGRYLSVDFDIGLPPAVNHADPATFAPDHPLNPTVNSLHWNWQGGYVFLALEGRWVKPDDSLGGYSFHIATDAHLIHVSIPADFSLTEDSAITLRFDAAKLFTAAHAIAVTADPITQSTHSAPGDELATRIAENISRVFSFVSIAPGVSSVPAGVPNSPIPPGTTAYPLAVPKHFPQPSLPRDNPLIVEGVTLGKRLFNETRLSANNAQSCASCHAATAAYSDAGKALSVGVDRHPGSRNAMPLFNLAWAAESGYTWDGRRARIRDQALAPIQDAREMHQSLDVAVKKLSADDSYPAEFAKAFGSPGISPERLGLAIEQYLLTLISADSKFDRALDKRETLTDQEKRGLLLFVTEHDPARGVYGADCFHCHAIPLFTDHQFRSNGLDADSADPGRGAVTLRSADFGRFKTPSLRNIARSGPYMHDGRFKTLEEVIEHYSDHVQAAASLDPNLAKHLLTMPDGEKRAGVNLPADDRAALIAFLNTLTDEKFVAGGEQKEN